MKLGVFGHTLFSSTLLFFLKSFVSYSFSYRFEKILLNYPYPKIWVTSYLGLFGNFLNIRKALQQKDCYKALSDDDTIFILG